MSKEGERVHFIGKLLEILDADMKIPEMYGFFHLTFFILSIALGIWLCRYKKNGGEKFVRKLLLVSAIIVIILEIYKQINFTFSYDGTKIISDYQWYSFPFQFCSTPMYVSLIAAIVKSQKIHNALCAYLATFSVFAGLCVMLYPPQVFIDTIGINVQSMVCHGAMISIGIYLLGSQYVKLEHKTILKAVPVFAVCIFIASVLNEIAYRSGLLERETFNMFFISPYCEGTLPVYSTVQAHIPFPWCTIIYITVFSLAAYVILLIAMLIKYVYQKKHKLEIR